MNKIIQRINSNQNFVITSHINPDGDNVGSSVAMTKFLKNLGKNPIHALEDDIPENLGFLLKDHQVFKNYEDVLSHFAGESFDLIILDSADKSRMALNSQILEKASEVINIDHHISNNQYGSLNYILPKISSTAEVVTLIMRAIDESAIDVPVATAAYTGISTDTGNFLFPSVSADTFMAAAFLTQKGADRTLVANEIYRSTSLPLRKLTKLLLDTFTIENQVGIMVMTQKSLEEAGVNYKDTDEVTNMAVDTKGVEVGILIKENAKNSYRISLRSKGKVNVCEIANLFGGGGHHNAAGCTITGEIEEIRETLQKLAYEQIKKDIPHA